MPSSAQNLPTRDELAFDSGKTLEIYQCAGCGLAQVAAAPVPYFREVIRAVAVSDEMRVFRESQIVEFAATFGLTNRKVLEVGSGRGEFLTLLNGAGMNASGTEAGAESARYASSLGLNVQGAFPDQDFMVLEGAPFDAFFCFNFMEHWPEPRRVLRCIRQNLSAGAVGLVEVPNFDLLLEKRMATEFVSDHLSYFTSSSLRTALEISGFDVLEVKEVWYRYILSATVRKRPHVDGNKFYDALNSQREQVSSFIDRSGSPGTAVWGAGHQALASLALMGLGGKVRYVVDSAPFKQGRFTPATHLPIVSPDELDKSPVGSILVVAAGFSDEVVRIIRCRWGYKFKLGVLREEFLEEL